MGITRMICANIARHHTKDYGNAFFLQIYTKGVHADKFNTLQYDYDVHKFGDHYMVAFFL